jgi:hypothetical protein
MNTENVGAKSIAVNSENAGGRVCKKQAGANINPVF